MAQITIKWKELKKFVDETKLYNFLNYLELETKDVYVWLDYQGMTFFLTLIYGTTDYEDFNKNYKTVAILKNDIADDGIRRTKMNRVTEGRFLKDIYMQFTTARKEYGDPSGLFYVKLFDKNEALTDDESIAVKTTVGFAPKYSYDLYAGGLQTLEPLTENVYSSCTVAGSVVNIMNRKLAKPQDNFLIVGIGIVSLNYYEQMPILNTIETSFSHSAGCHVPLQIEFQIYA